MANIVGGPLLDFVQKQIKVRQETIGGKNDGDPLLSSNILHNNRNAWVRLASSVNVIDGEAGETRINDANESNEFGNNLAKKYTLFGGVNFNPLSTKGGISNEKIPRAATSYGIGDTTQGYQPIPGIENVSIRHVDDGAIRKIDIRLKAHNKQQFSIMDSLYMRLGYTMLLEWGHTNYIDNEGNFESSLDINDVYDPFIKGEKKFNELHTDITQKRKKLNGNYDGALFLITNFNWAFNEDGSYSITLNGLSKGALLDSLILNFPGEAGSVTPYLRKKITSPDEKQVVLKKLGRSNIPEDSSLNKHYDSTISQFFLQSKIDELRDAGVLVEEQDSSEEANFSFDGEFTGNDVTILDQQKSALNQRLFEDIKSIKNSEQKRSSKEKILFRQYKEGDNIQGVCLKFTGTPSAEKDKYYESYYITLGRLLQHIKDILPSEANANIDIDNSPDDNLMFTHFFQHSADPGICLIPFTYYDGNNTAQKLLYEILGNGFREKADEGGNKEYQGKLMDIFINVEFIAKVLRQKTNKNTGIIPLYTTLDEIVRGVNKALGSINNLHVTYVDKATTSEEGEQGDSATGESLKIQDDTIIPGIGGGEEDNDVKLRLYGVLPKLEGSFVRNISSGTQIDSNLLNLISIGSTASSINQSNALLNRWNAGLEDRVRLKDLTDDQDQSTQDGTQKLTEKLNKTYSKYIKDFVKETYGGKGQLPKDPETYQSRLKQILEYDLAIQTLNGKIAGKSFIPLGVTLEIDGLSGFLLHQRLSVTNEILPTSYVENVNFLIRAIDHTISRNEWTTTLSTITTPKRIERGTDLRGTGGFDLKNPPKDTE